MNYQHKILAAGHWQDFSLIEQMANIGSEVERTIKWRQKNSPENSNAALIRALELLTLTIDDPKNIHRLKEITRVREILLDYFLGDNIFKSSDKIWQNYFNFFAYAARVKK
jgi:hypothetical protein